MLGCPQVRQAKAGFLACLLVTAWPRVCQVYRDFPAQGCFREDLGPRVTQVKANWGPRVCQVPLGSLVTACLPAILEILATQATDLLRASPTQKTLAKASAPVFPANPARQGMGWAQANQANLAIRETVLDLAAAECRGILGHQGVAVVRAEVETTIQEPTSGMSAPPPLSPGFLRMLCMTCCRSSTTARAALLVD